MAVNFLPQAQLSYPGNADVSGGINSLGNALAQSVKETRDRNALIKVSNALQTNDLAGARSAAFESGNPQLALSVNNLLTSQQERAEDRTFRQTESARTQRNADRTFQLAKDAAEGGRVPAGFRKTASGGLEPIPNGPEDPEYLRKKTAATDKGRPLSVTDVTKLSDEGGKYANIVGFGNSFQDKYAGYKMQAVGNAAMTAGRYLPEGVVGKDLAEASTFWQGYDRFKNVVRNDLFGSALTKPETEAFERADVNPGMDPAQIKRNLATQQTIAENGLKRKANALISAGYKPETIAAAYGLDVRSITGQPQTATIPMPGTQPAAPAQAPAAAPTAPVRVSSAQERDALPPGTQYVAPDGSVRTKQ